MKGILLSFLIVFAPFLYAESSDLNPRDVRMAAVLFPETTHQSENDFINMVDNYIDEAQKKQVNIILFPELLTLNMLNTSEPPTIEQLHSIAQFKNKYIQHLKSKAMTSNMIIIGGTTLTEKDNKFYNTAIVAFPKGDVKFVDKTLLTPWELSNHITGVGKSEPLSFQTPWGTAALLICYETESAEIVSKLSKLNPNLVFIPSNTAGLSSLERVTIASKYIAVSQFAYTVLTGVTTNIPRNTIGEDSVGQAILATPQQTGYPLAVKSSKFNQPDLFIVDADITKINQDKLSSKSTFAARDYMQQH